MTEDQAFEYVLGTLRGDERVLFEQALARDPALQHRVRFWEENMMELNPQKARVPHPDTWTKIEAAIAPRVLPQTSWSQRFGDFLRWGLPVVAALVLVVTVFIIPRNSVVQPDYIAVLTNDDGKAVVTALSQKGEAAFMTLHWESTDFAADKHLQLWAVSKRDGQARPLAVIEDSEQRRLELDQALWRLVTDADHLILTEEELGGSAIDEPSKRVLAKGVCVRLS